MWEDPIVKETRELRDQYAAKLKYDANAIFKDILKRQEKSDRKRMVLSSEKTTLKNDVASL